LVTLYDEIRRRMLAEEMPLRDQVLWRIHQLGGHADLTERANRLAFADILDAFVPENFELVLNPAQRCEATNHGGGIIEFTGLLVTGGTQVAELERRILLGPNRAEHRRIRVIPRYRGNRIAPRSLIRCISMYEKVGIEQVRVRACWSGTWFWALWGFHFADPSERERVRNHAQGIVDAFGGGLDAGTLEHPLQFARLGEPETITFDELADQFPHRRDAYEDIAYQNGLGVHDPISFGRAVLLTAPSWYGCLDLSGADRLIFDDRARRTVGAEGGA
jgi:GNAT superfamily N-acetyltransferase